MTNPGKDPKCQFWCWVSAAIAGALIFIMLLTIAGKSFFAALILGALGFGLLGPLFNWLFCAPVPAMGESARSKANAVAAPAASAAPTPALAKDPVKPSVQTAPSATAATNEAAVPASAAPAATISAPKPEAAKAAPKAKAKPAASGAGSTKAKPAKAKAKPAAARVDLEDEGTLAGADEGTKPALLKKARAGGADDLKRIKGIGPKLEGVCNKMGVYHFDQIAAWSADEMAWIDANLEGFKGRAKRDNWVEQAKTLAAGGETEFSKRVGKGSVY